jgi:hypothetical protein
MKIEKLVENILKEESEILKENSDLKNGEIHSSITIPFSYKYKVVNYTKNGQDFLGVKIEYIQENKIYKSFLETLVEDMQDELRDLTKSKNYQEGKSTNIELPISFLLDIK